MKKLVITVMSLMMLMTTFSSCRRYIYRPPVYRPVEYVPDSMIHNDIPKGEDENQQMLEEIEDEPVIAVPDIPQESDLLQDENRNVNVEKVMKEGI